MKSQKAFANELIYKREIGQQKQKQTYAYQKRNSKGEGSINNVSHFALHLKLIQHCESTVLQ